MPCIVTGVSTAWQHLYSNSGPGGRVWVWGTGPSTFQSPLIWPRRFPPLIAGSCREARWPLSRTGPGRYRQRRHRTLAAPHRPPPRRHPIPESSGRAATANFARFGPYGSRPVMWRPPIFSRQFRGEGRFRRHIRRRSSGSLKLHSSRRFNAEVSPTPDGPTVAFSVFLASGFGSTSGEPCRSPLSATTRRDSGAVVVMWPPDEGGNGNARGQTFDAT
jgi:hypothetical protein